MELAADEATNTSLVAEVLADKQKLAQQHGMKQLHIYYTRIDEDQCETLPRGYYIFWSGPYPSAVAAKQVCNALGWTNREGSRKCYGRTIDKDRKGKRRIAPDGTYY